MKYSSLVGRLDSQASHAWAINAVARRLRAEGRDVVLLTIGDPDFPTPPPVVERAVESLRAGRTGYAPFAGEPGLRAAIARRHAEATGCPVGADNVVVFLGAQNALYAVFMCLAEAGDEVIVPEPRYVTYETIVSCTGAERVDVGLDPERGFHLDPARVAAAVTPRTRAVFLNTPHNPTGMVMTRGELEGIAAIARERDLWVVTDEVYADLTFGVPHVSIAGLEGMGERTVTVGSVSKSHAMQGWRIGWAVAPEELAGHLTNMVKPMHFGISPFTQDAAIEALETQSEVTRTMGRVYQERRDLLCSRVNEMPGLRCAWPEGSMFLLVDVRATGLDDQAFCHDLLEREGVALLPAGAFGPSARGHVRLSLTAPLETLAEACERMERYTRFLSRKLA